MKQLLLAIMVLTMLGCEQPEEYPVTFLSGWEVGSIVVASPTLDLYEVEIVEQKDPVGPVPVDEEKAAFVTTVIAQSVLPFDKDRKQTKYQVGDVVFLQNIKARYEDYTWDQYRRIAGPAEVLSKESRYHVEE